MLAIDAYSSRIQQSTFQQFRAVGFGLHIQNVWTLVAGRWHSPEVAIPNLNDALAAGLRVAAYCAVVDSGGASVDMAREVTGDLWGKLEFLALDIEVDGTTTAAIREAIERVKALGQRPVIYTAYWFWHDRLGSPTDFTDVPLWNAYYDDDPDFDFANLPYGGWTPDQVIGEQYSGSTSMFGVDVDRSQFTDSFFGPAPADIAPPLSLEARVEALEAALKRLGIAEVDVDLVAQMRAEQEAIKALVKLHSFGSHPLSQEIIDKW